jgi:hypothetical protein
MPNDSVSAQKGDVTGVLKVAPSKIVVRMEQALAGAKE